MTRVGRKRTYLEFSAVESQVNSPENSTEGASPAKTHLENPQTTDSGVSAPPKKKRKRTPKSKRDGHSIPKGEGEDANSPSEPVQDLPAKPVTTKAKKNKKNKHVSASERRRLQRIAEKNAATTCFACREKGHAAKDCPKGRNGEGSNPKQVGMCYRCGSTRHSLSRCKKPEDPLNPLPHASCFVCNGKGHLASTCPQNKSKGIYPNGGSCKLCGDITHLAKDCAIRKKDTGSLAAVLGLQEADTGADEDDFHTIGRRKQELDRHDKRTEKLQRTMGVKVGAHSGVVKAFGKTSAPAKKVVFF